MTPEELLALGFSREVVVIITAVLPIVELRGAIPLAINIFHLPWYYALFLAIVGNLAMVAPVLLLFHSVYRLLSRIAFINRFLQWILERTRRRSGIVEKYERIGLILFVAIPLPFTGAWTGALAAVIFGLKFSHAFLSIFIGLLIAGGIVTCLSLLGWLGAIIAGIGLSIFTIASLWKTRRSAPSQT